MKIKLPQVTLIAITGIGYQDRETANALKRSQEGIEFGAVKYIQLGSIKDIDTWSLAAIYELPKYVETSHCLLIHENGHVVNPEQWDFEWLKYDFIGSPWPLPTDDISYRTPTGRIVRVGNSVSLRSKKLLDLVATRPMERHYGNINEDGQICVWEREWLESQGCKFAPLHVAKWFGRELDMPENMDVDKPFVFHYNRVQPGRNKEFEHLLK